MIVTADPVGDFNATSQILRYSALAREVTVPRIPSVSATILAGIANSHVSTAEGPHPRSASGSSSQASAQSAPVDDGVVEMAFSEIARLDEAVEILGVRLADAEGRRGAAEASWQGAEERAERIEREVREECWGEMEVKLGEERRRWSAAWGEETGRKEEHWDRKMDLLSRGMAVLEDPGETSEYARRLEEENEVLRRRLENLERELQCGSPTKRRSPQRQASMLRSLGWGNDGEEGVLGSSVLNKLNGMSLGGQDEEASGESLEVATPMKTLGMGRGSLGSPGKTPGSGKKMRKLTARKWDLMDENEMGEYGVY